MSIAEFETLLDAYGAERTRWPMDKRAAAVPLLAASEEARTLLAQAQALDTLLGKAPAAIDVDRDALARRIVLAAARGPRIASVGQPASSKGARGRNGATGGVRGRAWMSLGPVGVGALVTAASLAAGIMIGLSGLSQTLLTPVQQLTGLPVAVSQAGSTLHVDALDEDLL